MSAGVVRCGCGARLAVESGQWRSCLPCRRAARQERQERELEAAHHRAVLEDLVATAGAATARAVLGGRL